MITTFLDAHPSDGIAPGMAMMRHDVPEHLMDEAWDVLSRDAVVSQSSSVGPYADWCRSRAVVHQDINRGMLVRYRGVKRRDIH